MAATQMRLDGLRAHIGAGMTTRTLYVFLAITFGLTWSLIGLMILFPAELELVFGKMGYSNPLFILAAYSPGIAGVFLVWRYHGVKGLGQFLRRLTLWRMPVFWWLFLVFGIPAVFYAGAAIKGNITGAFPFSTWYGALSALAGALLIGPIEELGWRGVALPLMQRRFTPFQAGLLLGAIWAMWHIPAFLLGGSPQSEWSFAAFSVGVVALSLIMTAMFNAAHGSLLVMVLFHFQANGPIWPNAQPWDTLFYVMVAMLVVWLNRHALFRRGSAVTRVLPDT